MRSHQAGRKLPLLQLLGCVAVFSVFVFTIQSSFFADNNRKLDLQPEDIQILSDFQSSVQQCVANRGLGLSAHIIDHCNLILKFPEGTNSTWYNAQFKVFEALEFKYNVCEAVLLWEQVCASFFL
jgi:hypothetical protein